MAFPRVHCLFNLACWASPGRREFTLDEVYALEVELELELKRLHPANLQIRDKIRQQLQFLRDLALVEFLGGGSYRM